MRITVMGVKLYQQGLEGYFRDPGFDQKLIQSGICKDTKFLDGIHHLTAAHHQVGFAKNVGMGCCISMDNSMICSDIWHKYHE